MGNTAVYDATHNRLIIFSGLGVLAGNLNDVWIFTLSGTPTWYQLTPSGMPPPVRRGAGAIYDPIRDRLIVFGGRKNATSGYNDVWALPLSGVSAWTQLAPSGTPPSPRRGQSAIYDPGADRMVVFGGNDNVNVLNDVWAMSLGPAPVWTQLAPTGTPPPARFVHRAQYDSARKRMLVFGGQNGTVDLNDVWALTLTGVPAWTQVVTAGTPPSARDWPAAVYDPIRDRMVLFGGEDFAGVPNSETWALTLAGTPTWSQLAPAGTPPSARVAPGVYDPTGDRMVMFSGTVSDYINDTWALSLAGGTSWTQLDPGSPARFNPAAIYDPVRHRMLVFGGGYTLDGVTLIRDNDVWALSMSGAPVWSKLAVNGTPPAPRDECSAIYDPVRDRLIIWGGYDGTNVFADTWALSLSGTPTWTMLTPTGSPGARDSFSGIYDPIRDRLVFFGGSDEVTLFNSVWALTLGTSPPLWTQLAPSGTPPGERLEHAAVYDPVRDRMIIVGGRGSPGSIELGDSWALSLAGTPAWTQLSPTGAPPAPRDSHSGIYDPVRDRMVIFGGYDGTTLLNDVWALSLAGTPAWAQLSPGGAASPWPRQVLSTIYDPVADRMALFGGADPSAITVFNDAWFLTWGATLGAPGPVAGTAVELAPAVPNPARAGVSIEFTLPRTSAATLRVYDISGRLVSTLLAGPQPAGTRSLRWDGREASGATAPAGLYFYELRVGNHRLARRTLVAKRAMVMRQAHEASVRGCGRASRPAGGDPTYSSASPSSSSSSTTIASVVSTMAPMLAACWSAARVTLVGSRIPASARSTNSPVSALKPKLSLPA